MRKITKETCKAFYDLQTCKKSNVVVDYGINHHFYYFLHNNLIGDYNPKNGELVIEDAGRKTKTTKERLNGILDVYGLGYIYQKNFTWYYVDQNGNEEKRNGRKTFQNV